MNRMFGLYVDAAGRLWIWTEDPNTLVLYEQGKFRAFAKGIDFEADDIYNPIWEDGGPRFRFGEEGYVYNQTKFERRSAWQAQLPRVFRAGDSSVVWINTNEGYYGVNEKESTFSPKDGPLPFDPRKATGLQTVEIDGAIWFLFPFTDLDYRLCVFRNGRMQVSSVSIRLPRFLIADHGSNLWIGDFYEGLRKITAASIRRDDPLHLQVEHSKSGRPAGSGSGFVIASDGLLLTNAHVVRNARTVRATFADGTESEAKLLGADPATDTAVLQSMMPLS